MTASLARRRAILVGLVLVAVACLGVTGWVVATRAVDGGLGDKLESLGEDDPGSSAAEEREQLLSLSREFATRFNTYDESMLDDEGHLPEYAAVEDLMTPKFGSVFADNLGYAEKTVAQGAASVGTVYAVGVASHDSDSAEVLVAGTIELSYPYPEDERGRGGSADGGSDAEDPRVSTGPQRFRYELSLVKVDGAWLVDDLDDIDDGLPPFSQPSIPEEPTSDQSTPTAPVTPSDDPTAEQTGEGER